jgi:hypothetical protein
MQINPEKQKHISFLIAFLFSVSGIALFVTAVLLSSQIIGLIGLGLVFWGALFLLITPKKQIEGSFLISSALPAYMTIDKMVNEQNSKNEAYNIPPCPRDIYLPKHLDGLKQMVTFIPAKCSDGMVEIEDIARGIFSIEKPKGVLIISPGMELIEKIEQKRNMDFTKILFDELDQKLPCLLNELHLAQEIKMTTNENELVLQINDSLYQNLYSQKYDLKSIHLLGCPLVNAAACAIAKSTGQPIVIQEINSTPSGKTIFATFKIANRIFKQQQEKFIEDVTRSTSRRIELLRIITDSMRIVDLLFNILIGLQKKRVNWQQLEDYCKDFEENYSFVGTSMPSVNLSFKKISESLRNKISKETSEEAFLLLKDIYNYFDTLNLEVDIKDGVPNFLSAKAIILSYFTLNDLLLGKVVGEKVNRKETHQLEKVLQTLNNNTDFKVDIYGLKTIIDRLIPEPEMENVIDTSREIFRQQLNHLS